MRSLLLKDIFFILAYSGAKAGLQQVRCLWNNFVDKKIAAVIIENNICITKICLYISEYKR